MVRMWNEDGLSIPTTSMWRICLTSSDHHWLLLGLLDDHSQHILNQGNFTNSTPQNSQQMNQKREKPHSKEHTTESFSSTPPPQTSKKRTPSTPFFYGELPLAFLGDFRCISNHPHGASRHVARHGARTKPGNWRRIYTQQNEQRKPNPDDIPLWAGLSGSLNRAYFSPYIPGRKPCLKLTANDTENRPFAPKGNNRIPTIHFSGAFAVSFRQGNLRFEIPPAA